MLVTLQTQAITEKIRNHMENLYRAGGASITQLNEPQINLVRASGVAAASRISYRIGLINLNAATGVMELLVTQNLPRYTLA